jgi:UDP-N-acetylglucosamine 3-dehydrogenase
MQTLGVAVVGLGIGRRHIQAYARVPGVRLVAIAGTDVGALDRTRLEFDVPIACQDLDEILALPDVDAVSICTPDRLHTEQSLAALRAGKHVLVEKPLAISLEEARAVVRAAGTADRALMVGHNYRFIPQFARLKQLVDSSAMGPPFYAESSYIQDLYAMERLGPEYWRFKDPQDFYLGGAIHNVDMLRWLLGEIAEVHAFATHIMPFYPLDDNYVTNFRFDGGQIGRLLLILGARLKDQFLVDVSAYGPQGGLRATMQRDEVVQNLAGLPGDTPLIVPIESADSFALEIAHFVDCIRAGSRPMVDAIEGARNVAVCLAAIQSAQENRPIRVDYAGLA